MNTAGPCSASNPPLTVNDCFGITRVGDGDRRDVVARSTEPAPPADKLVFERQGEFARELLCFMFDTGAMADVEVTTDDCGSIRCHVEVLVRVSGYFRRTLRRGMPPFLLRDAIITVVYATWPCVRSSVRLPQAEFHENGYDARSCKQHIMCVVWTTWLKQWRVHAGSSHPG